MLKFTRFHFLPIIILILISVIVHHVWFFNLSPITYGDWTIDHIEKVKEYFSLPTIWRGENNLGGVDLGIFFWPLQFPMGLLANFNLEPALLERLFILWPIALITPISMYFLSYFIFKSKTAAMISAIVFTFNTILIVARSGPLLLNLALAFVPFLLLFFFKTLENKKLSYSLITALIGFMISFFEVRLFYIAVWMLFFYFIYHLFVIKPKDKKNIRVYILAGLVVVIPIVLNSYAFLSLQSIQSLTSNEIFNRALFGTQYLKLLKIMTLFHSDWTGGKTEGWVVKPVLIRFYFIPIIAFLGILFSKNKKVVFFSFLAFISIFLAKQSLLPFSHVYQWLFDHIPGFNAFRESGKFSYFMILSYAILIGSFIQVVLNWGKEKKQQILSFIIIFLIASLFLWNTRPVITGELGWLYVPRKIPKDYFIVKDYLLKQSDFFRTLWIPLSSQWGIRTSNHPIINNYLINTGVWKEFAEKQKMDIFGINVTDQILDLSSIKYVIVPLEDKENEDNFYRFAGKRKNFIKELNELGYLKEIKIGTGKVTIYENSNYRPHIYVTYQKESITKYVPFTNIDFLFNKPTEYKIDIRNISSLFYLNFSEGYHLSWKVRIGEFNWFKAVVDKNYFLPDKYHFENEAKLNSFYIDPKIICQNNLDCRLNNDGTYDFVITLFFKPQSFVYLGLIIGILTISLIFTYLIYALFKKNHHLDSNIKK